MAKFLTTLETSARIERIIRTAKKELTLITPYLKLTQIFFERLKDADTRGVKLKLIYGKEELDTNELRRLKELQDLELYFCENLHAKCYFNEDLMVITSLNLHEFSQTNNREMGVIIKREKDSELFNEGVLESSSIIQASVREEINEKISYENNIKGGYPAMGFCIRQHESIRHNPKKPLCDSCYEVWVQFADPMYTENYCHKCGKEWSTTYSKPLCNDCYGPTSILKTI